MRKRATRTAAGFAVTATSLMLLELVLHLFIRPSAIGYGVFLGQELPPFRVVMDVHFTADQAYRVWHKGGLPNPENLTNGDLWGVFREDPTLGYVYAENSVSGRGWWRSNNIGANSGIPTARHVPPGKRRIFVFGESYGRGSRVRQSESWSSVIQRRQPRLELANLAVDGYSMGQAYMRFQAVQAAYDFDTAIFLFVPETDLWREINTMRFLGEGWYAFTILPRFVLDGEVLKWVTGPYPIGSEIYRHDLEGLTPPVREHLRRYDRFYFPALYDSPPVVGRSLIYKMIAKTIGEGERAVLYRDSRSRLDGEGMAIVKRIFAEADRSLRRGHRRFVLILLPDPDLIETIRGDTGSSQRAIWNARARVFAEAGLTTIDLLAPMLAEPPAELDRGYDHTHYGPRANRTIARLIEAELAEVGVL